MEYWKRYSSWPVRTLKSCLEALENPVLEVPARHGSRGSNSSFRAPSSRPPPAASTLRYPPFATLNRCHQSTELPTPSSFSFPSLSLSLCTLPRLYFGRLLLNLGFYLSLPLSLSPHTPFLFSLSLSRSLLATEHTLDTFTAADSCRKRDTAPNT